MKYREVLIILVMLIIITEVSADDQQLTFKDCSVQLKDGILTLENSQIGRSYNFNSGHLISTSLANKSANKIFSLANQTPDVQIAELPIDLSCGSLKISEIDADAVTPAQLQAEVVSGFGNLKLKRVFRIFPDCPAIACDYYLKADGPVELDNSKQTVIDTLSLPGVHFKLTAVEFFDMTDRTNTLVKESSILAYKSDSFLKGNLLFADSLVDNSGFFWLKEAPCSNVQLNYPGYDFIGKIGSYKVVGLGVTAKDMIAEQWIKCYGMVFGVTDATEFDKLSALRTYQQNIRIHSPERDEMVLMNTWGDRNKGSKISEKFIIDEIKAAKEIGMTHLQIDEGWQYGNSDDSINGPDELDNIWKKDDFWTPDKKRFPNGFAPIVEQAKKTGIKLGLWFVPCIDDDYINYERDAAAIIDLYKKYGITTFKVDGIEVHSKLSDIRLYEMFSTVLKETQNNVVFNIDMTNNQRFGYHYFNQFGNIFVENRYTDWKNYYPHWTLRNLWMLSRYVPTQNLQFEFLNKWRMLENYPNDPFAPANMSFEYTFAITMMSQPLAWFEATGLPSEGLKIADAVKTYRQYQWDIHCGQIFPIGQEPSGLSWTGFQSIQKDHGYFLIFREKNQNKAAKIKTWLKPGQKIRCELILGQGKNFNAKTNEESEIKFTLPAEFSFALYIYRINN